MSERVARRRAETRRRIVETAMRLFTERGYEAVTVADITEAADVAKGTFFTHFPSKRDIFRYFGGEAVEAMEATVDDEGTAEEQLTAMLLAAVEWHRNNQELSRQMYLVRSFNFSTDLGSENQQRFSRVVVGLLRRGVETGEFRADLDLDAATALIQGAYYLSLLGWHSTPSGPSPDDRLRALLHVLFQGMT
ncbi:MAG: TetR/AcrR family transcriptional regulator [Arachnia propionica]|uniref:TetR/AcrR family transcriptional regulator n=1 Tax=Arachnia propionica TaxID=1750 RepID=UPI0026F71D82|nr:TetR/AcrR family transcriptional regulator [Arachnia propionica]